MNAFQKIDYRAGERPFMPAYKTPRRLPRTINERIGEEGCVRQKTKVYGNMSTYQDSYTGTEDSVNDLRGGK